MALTNSKMFTCCTHTNRWGNGKLATFANMEVYLHSITVTFDKLWNDWHFALLFLMRLYFTCVLITMKYFYFINIGSPIFIGRKRWSHDLSFAPSGIAPSPPPPSLPHPIDHHQLATVPVCAAVPLNLGAMRPHPTPPVATPTTLIRVVKP